MRLRCSDDFEMAPFAPVIISITSVFICHMRCIQLQALCILKYFGFLLDHFTLSYFALSIDIKVRLALSCIIINYCCGGFCQVSLVDSITWLP